MPGRPRYCEHCGDSHDGVDKLCRRCRIASLEAEILEAQKFVTDAHASEVRKVTPLQALQEISSRYEQMLDEAEAENARLRGAMSDFADGDNWIVNWDEDEQDHYWTWIALGDPHAKAKKALEEASAEPKHIWEGDRCRVCGQGYEANHSTCVDIAFGRAKEEADDS